MNFIDALSPGNLRRTTKHRLEKIVPYRTSLILVGKVARRDISKILDEGTLSDDKDIKVAHFDGQDFMEPKSCASRL